MAIWKCNRCKTEMKLNYTTVCFGCGSKDVKHVQGEISE
jgi:ABC-type ATPase with predicted acetyltransferase domain